MAGKDFVSRYWHEFVPYIEKLTAEEDNKPPSLAALNNVLAGIQSGHMKMWVGVAYEGEDKKLLGFFITSKYVGGPSGADILYVSYLTGLTSLPDEAWYEGLQTVKREAVSEGCTKIVATTKWRRVVEWAERLGATVDSRLTWRL